MSTTRVRLAASVRRGFAVHHRCSIRLCAWDAAAAPLDAPGPAPLVTYMRYELGAIVGGQYPAVRVSDLDPNPPVRWDPVVMSQR